MIATGPCQYQRAQIPCRSLEGLQRQCGGAFAFVQHEACVGRIDAVTRKQTAAQELLEMRDVPCHDLEQVIVLATQCVALEHFLRGRHNRVEARERLGVMSA